MEFNTVTWNNHLTEIFGNIKEVLLDDSLKDCTIACEGKLFKAHRLLLCGISPYFYTIFTTNQASATVVLQDVSAEILQIILNFIYHGQANVKKTHISAIIAVAEHLQIKPVAAMARRTQQEMGNLSIRASEAALPQDLTYGGKRSIASDEGGSLKVSQLSDVIEVERCYSAEFTENSESSSESLALPVQRKINHARSPTVKQYMSPSNRKLPEIGRSSAPINAEPANLDVAVGRKHSLALYDQLKASLDESKAFTGALDGKPVNDKPGPIAPGEKWFQGRLEFMLSQRGKPLLVHDGHSFGIQYIRKDKKYWQCNLSRKYNCKARVTTTDTGDIIVTNNEHCHTEIRQHLRKDYKTMKLAASLAANRNPFGLSSLPLFSPNSLTLPNLGGEFMDCSSADPVGPDVKPSTSSPNAGQQDESAPELGSLNLTINNWAIKRESNNCGE